MSRILAAILFVSVTWSPAAAEVVRIEVQSRADVAGGKTFGATGPYEKLAGRIYFEVDPSLAPNKIITDIDKAPRNARGRVEFSSDFFLMKPKQIERGNGTRAVRGLEPRRQRDARLLQPRDGQSRSDNGSSRWATAS